MSVIPPPLRKTVALVGTPPNRKLTEFARISRYVVLGLGIVFSTFSGLFCAATLINGFPFEETEQSIRLTATFGYGRMIWDAPALLCGLMGPYVLGTVISGIAWFAFWIDFWSFANADGIRRNSHSLALSSIRQ